MHANQPPATVLATREVVAAESALIEAKDARKSAYSSLDAENREVREARAAIKPATKRVEAAVARLLAVRGLSQAAVVDASEEWIVASSALSMARAGLEAAVEDLKAAREDLEETAAFTRAKDRLAMAHARLIQANREAAEEYPLFAGLDDAEMGDDGPSEVEFERESEYTNEEPAREREYASVA